MAHSARTACKSKHPQIGGSGSPPVTPTNSAGQTNSASERRCWENPFQTLRSRPTLRNYRRKSVLDRAGLYARAFRAIRRL